MTTALARYTLYAHVLCGPGTRISFDLSRVGGVPIAGLTAHETLTDILEVQQGEVVLITAAAGGVGHLPVRPSRALGGSVVATASRRNPERWSVPSTLRDGDRLHVRGSRRGDSIRHPRVWTRAFNGIEGETANQVVRAMRDGGRMVDLTGSASVVRPGVQVDIEYLVRADADRLAHDWPARRRPSAHGGDGRGAGPDDRGRARHAVVGLFRGFGKPSRVGIAPPLASPGPSVLLRTATSCGCWWLVL